MDIGAKILELLKERDWTEYRLYKEINKVDSIGQSTLNQIITGKKPNPTKKTLQKICNALNVSMSVFDDYQPQVDDVITHAEQMDLTVKERTALELYKKMPPNRQREELLEALEKVKDLPIKDQEALITIINSLSQ